MRPHIPVCWRRESVYRLIFCWTQKTASKPLAVPELNDARGVRDDGKVRTQLNGDGRLKDISGGPMQGGIATPEKSLKGCVARPLPASKCQTVPKEDVSDSWHNTYATRIAAMEPLEIRRHLPRLERAHGPFR